MLNFPCPKDSGNHDALSYHSLNLLLIALETVHAVTSTNPNKGKLRTKCRFTLGSSTKVSSTHGNFQKKKNQYPWIVLLEIPLIFLLTSVIPTFYFFNTIGNSMSSPPPPLLTLPPFLPTFPLFFFLD